MADDSPLSVTASIVGILTFVVALIAGVYARGIWLMSKMQSDLAIADACSSSREYLRQTAKLVSSNDDAESAYNIETLYVLEIDLVWTFARLLELSAVQRMRE